MTATDNHKCDMYCLWEDLDSRYKKCRNCLHNRNQYEYPQKNNQMGVGSIMGDDNWHLWRKHSDKDYNEYKKFLELHEMKTK